MTSNWNDLSNNEKQLLNDLVNSGNMISRIKWLVSEHIFTVIGLAGKGWLFYSNGLIFLTEDGRKAFFSKYH